MLTKLSVGECEFDNTLEEGVNDTPDDDLEEEKD